MIGAVLFDLDNTLLANDGEQFLEEFTSAVGRRLGVLASDFQNAAMVAGAALLEPHQHQTNQEVLVEAVARQLSLPQAEVAEAFLAVSSSEMGGLGLPWEVRQGAREVVQAVIASGRQVVVATSPVYLIGPILERMRRAGVHDLPWDAITTADVMHTMKPHPDYFVEAALLVGRTPEEVVMVGDHPFQDLPARKAGMRTYYVGEAIPGLDTGPSGPIRDFTEWLETEEARHPAHAARLD